MQVVHIDDEGSGEVVEDVSTAGVSAEFETDAFSVYAIVEIMLNQTVTTSDGATYNIEVTYQNTSGIPMKGTELLVTEVLPGDTGYDSYVDESIQKLGAKAENLDFSRVFDIKIVDAEDHDIVYEPTGDVEVSIRLAGNMLDDYTHVDVLHFVEEENFSADSFVPGSFTVDEMDSDVDGETVDFTTDSFSVYVVAGYKLEKIIEAGDGNSYRITVTFTEDVELPENAALSVTEFSGEEYEAYADRTAAFLNAAGFVYARIFDISIVDPQGTKIQPEAPVEVSVELLDAIEGTEAYSVVHFADTAQNGEDDGLSEQPADEDADWFSDQPELMTSETDGHTVTFTSGGFSAYAIVQGPDPIMSDAARITTLDELMEDQTYIFSIVRNGTNYMTGTSTANNTEFSGSTDITDAEAWLFESNGEPGKFYLYRLNGKTREYLYVTNGKAAIKLSQTEKTLFTVEENKHNSVKGTFYIYHVSAADNKNYALSVRGSRNFSWNPG